MGLIALAFWMNRRLSQNQIHREGAVVFDGYETVKDPCSEATGGFLFGGLSPPNKKSLLCVLGISAVRFLFWTRMP